MTMHSSLRERASRAVPVLIPSLLLAAVFVAPIRAEEPPADEAASQAVGEPIEGSVVSPGGEPVEGATVLAVSASAKRPRTPTSVFSPAVSAADEQRVAEARTDAEGRFRLEVEGAVPFTLRAEAPGVGVARLSDVRPGDVGEIVLSKGFALRGKVLDKLSGDPVADAEVEAHARFSDGLADEEHGELFKRTATTGEDGGFLLEALESNSYEVTAEADGYSRGLRHSVAVGLPGQAQEPLYLYVIPGVTLAGVVVDADGSPVDGADMSVRPERRIPSGMQRWIRSGGFTDETDEKGRFEIRGVPSATSYAVEARHDDFAPAWLTGIRVREGGRSTALRFVVDRGSELTARLLVDRQPFEGKLSVRLSYSVPGSEYAPTIAREQKEIRLENGKLTLDRLPAGEARLTLEPQGFSEITREEVVIPAGQSVDLGEFLLEAGLRITGKVLDPNEKPIASAQVEARRLIPGQGIERKVVESGGDGSFALGGLNEGSFRVLATAEGYGRGSVEDVESGGEPVLIRLAPAGSIRGRVVAGDPPKPVASFSVKPSGAPLEEFSFPMPGGFLTAAPLDFHQPSGEFELEGLAEGSYGIKIEASGYMAVQREEIEVAPGNATDVGDIVLERGATLRGTVSEAGTMKPVGGATVRIEEPGMFNVGAFMPDQKAALVTGPDGGFVLSGLAPGVLSVRVEHEGYSPATERVEVANGVPPADLAIELASGGSIEGTLRTSEGELLPGGLVMVMRGFTPDPNGIVSTDEYGHFRVDHLAPGSYRVMAMPQPEPGARPDSILGQLQMQSVDVVEGKTSIVNLPPGAGRVMVSGVVRRGAAKVEARMFWIRMAGDGATPEDFSAAVSDESGAYQVQLSSPGEYRVSIQLMEEKADEAYTPSVTVKVEVPDEEQVTLDVVIPDAVVSGTVLDADSGQPLKGVQVLAMEHLEDEPPAMSPLASSATTDAEGRYELRGLAEGEYRIAFIHDGYGAETLGPLDLDEYAREEGTNVALLPSSACKIRVVTENGDPINGAWVSVTSMPTTFMRGVGAETDMDGEVELTGLADGAHDLGVVAGGFAPHVVEGVLVGGDEEEETEVVALQTGAPLTVLLLDGEDRPISNAAVRIREENGSDLSALLQLGAIFEGRGLLTGPDGSLRLPNLEAGRYEIEARWQGNVVRDKVRVKLSGENRLELKLR